MRSPGHRLLACLALLATAATLAIGCVTAGRPFREDAVQLIEIGVTTKADIRSLLGRPWPTGLKDGQEAWTYGHYRYSAFGSARTRDLVLRFDQRGVIVSCSYNSTAPE